MEEGWSTREGVLSGTESSECELQGKAGPELVDRGRIAWKHIEFVGGVGQCETID